MGEIKLLRNITRCLSLPCVLSSTNTNVNNMLNLNSSSSQSTNAFWVNAIVRLFKCNVGGALTLIVVGNNNDGTCQIMLNNYIDSNYMLNLKIVDDHVSKIHLLEDLSIAVDASNQEKLLKIWEFLVSQSKTCLQGSLIFAFEDFIKVLKSFTGKNLDSCEFWASLCSSIHTRFCLRKPEAFNEHSQFFSHRMFFTDKSFLGIGDDTAEFEVQSSIDKHFYHFGQENGARILPFCYSSNRLVLDMKIYNLNSHFVRFTKDVLTSMSVWRNFTDQKSTVAQTVRHYIGKNIGLGSNPNAKSNNFKAQESMTFWAIANSTHQDFNGNTSGVKFLLDVVMNLQIPVETVDSTSGALIRRFYTISETPIPTGLKSFLNNVTIPYLIPEKPDIDFRKSLDGILNLGHCFRCPNEMGIDICFDALVDGRAVPCFVECKYTDAPQKSADIVGYIDKAKANMCPLTLFVSFTVVNDLQINLRPKNLRKKIRLSEEERGPKNFTINVYSVIYNSEGNNLIIKTIFESEKKAGGVFIIIETNFNDAKA